MAGLHALLTILASYPCWIINLSDCGMNRRDDDALLFATFLRRNEKRGYNFKPTCPSNGERYQSDVQGRCAESDAICYCASACECWATSTYLTSHMYKGDECGAKAEDIQHQLIDFKPGTEECLIDASPVVMRD